MTPCILVGECPRFIFRAEGGRTVILREIVLACQTHCMLTRPRRPKQEPLPKWKTERSLMVLC